MSEARDGLDRVSPKPIGDKRRRYQAPALTVFGEVRILTATGAGSGTDGMAMEGMSMMSDRACKQDLVQVGIHPLGCSLYLFRYRPGFGLDPRQRHFGVLAQEVQPLLPAAVSRTPEGLLQVDYAQLGIVTARH